METAKKVITYLGLALFLAVVGIIIYINVRDAQEQKKPKQPTPTRSVVQTTKSSSDREISKSLKIALESISSERMFAALTDLTSIQQHSGWRGGGTEGEKEALNYLQAKMNSMNWLISQGMEIERETFNVFLATEDHTSSVYLTAGEQTFEIPADAIRGNRDDLSLVTNQDSDGKLNDTSSNLVTFEGNIILIPDSDILNSLEGTSQQSNVLLVDYSLMDSINPLSVMNADKLLNLHPGAVVLVTQNSNVAGVSHGSFIGDNGGVFSRIPFKNRFPMLFIEMENLLQYGVEDWDGMAQFSTARVDWDVDVINPAESGNLIVHIPGKDVEHPILISAHIDSPNAPGALDDGSGSTILLEIAAILNENQIQPDVDLYLVWFGSEELVLYGSTYFTTTHSDLLNKLQTDIQVDCLSHPMDGMPGEVSLMFSHITSSDMMDDPLVKYLTNRGFDLGLNLRTTYWPFASDNGSLSAFNIPNVNIIYESDAMNNAVGGVWVAGHFHDPYDTVELAREVEIPFVNMTKMALTAALATSDQASFVEHAGEKKAVFLANHTESPHMTPAGFPEFSLTLINNGYQISVIPYGKTLKPEDINEADLVIIPPVYDYISGSDQYDTGWSPEEAAIINVYAQNGGRVFVVNSSHRLKLYNRIMEENEDWKDLNIITSQWGVQFTGLGSDTESVSTGGLGIVKGVPVLNITPDTAVSFKIESGEALAGIKNKAYLAFVEVGKGEVLILGDMTALGEYEQGPVNPQFVMNLSNWE